MLAKTPDPLGVMVGAKIRIFRTHRGMSQSDLAGKIGAALCWASRSANSSNLPGTSLPT